MRNRQTSVDMSHTGLDAIDRALHPQSRPVDGAMLEEMGLELIGRSVLPGDQFLGLLAAVDQAFFDGDGDGVAALMELV